MANYSGRLAGPLQVVGVPRHHAHREQRVFAPGIHGGTNGTTLPLPTEITPGGPSFNARYVSGNTHADVTGDGIVQTTNGRDVYHRSQQTIGYEKGDTCADVVTFAEVLHENRRRDNMRTTSYRMLSWPILNQQLRDNPRLRKELGSILNVNDGVRKKWRYVGVTQTKPDAIGEAGNWTHEVNFIVHGRARIPNLWLAGARSNRLSHASIGELNTLYIVWTRHPYVGEVATEAEFWNPTKKRKEIEETDEERLAKKTKLLGELKWDPQTQMKQLGDLEMQDSQSLADVKLHVTATKPLSAEVAKLPAREFYWRADPYVSYDGSPPPVSVYTGDPLGDRDNQFVGDVEKIGRIIHISKGPNNRTPDQVRLARQALYPDERGTGYFKPLRQLDEIEVFIGFGVK